MADKDDRNPFVAQPGDQGEEMMLLLRVNVAVGSSKMMIFAWRRTARAISTICRFAVPSDWTIAVGSTGK